MGVRSLYLLLCLLLLSSSFLVFKVRDTQARWVNVPPVPSVYQASAFSLGDKQTAYRSYGLMIQNFGDIGGRSTPLAEYDYKALADWFSLAHELDQRSDFMPALAAFYFGSVEDIEKLRALIPYLTLSGNSPQGQKWRWLAHAVYLARFELADQALALDLAYLLAALPNPEMPGWTRQMPAFILNAKGDKDAAYAFMLEILKSSVGKVHPNEVNFMRDYICTQILEPAVAQNSSLCEEII